MSFVWKSCIKGSNNFILFFKCEILMILLLLFLHQSRYLSLQKNNVTFRSRVGVWYIFICVFRIIAQPLGHSEYVSNHGRFQHPLIIFLELFVNASIDIERLLDFHTSTFRSVSVKHKFLSILNFSCKMRFCCWFKIKYFVNTLGITRTFYKQQIRVAWFLLLNTL